MRTIAFAALLAVLGVSSAGAAVNTCNPTAACGNQPTFQCPDAPTTGLALMPRTCNETSVPLPRSDKWKHGVPGGQSTALPYVDWDIVDSYPQWHSTIDSCPRQMMAHVPWINGCFTQKVEYWLLGLRLLSWEGFRAYDIEDLPISANSLVFLESVIDGQAYPHLACSCTHWNVLPSEYTVVREFLKTHLENVLKLAFNSEETVVKFENLSRCKRTVLMLYAQVIDSTTRTGSSLKTDLLLPLARAGKWDEFRSLILAFAAGNKYLLGLVRILETCDAAKTCTSDLFFVMDESGSIGASDYAKAKIAAQSVVGAFGSVGPDSTRVGLLSYSTAPRPQFLLTNYTSKLEVTNAIGNLTYNGGYTNTGAAISAAIEQVALTPRPAADIASLILVVITDGKSQDTVAIPATTARAQGITLFAVGVGSGAVQQELLEIGGSPSKVFNATNYTALNGIASQITSVSCLTPATIGKVSQASAVEKNITLGHFGYMYFKLAFEQNATGTNAKFTVKVTTGKVTFYFSRTDENPNPRSYDFMAANITDYADVVVKMGVVARRSGVVPKELFVSAVGEAPNTVVNVNATACNAFECAQGVERKHQNSGSAAASIVVVLVAALLSFMA